MYDRRVRSLAPALLAVLAAGCLDFKADNPVEDRDAAGADADTTPDCEISTFSAVLVDDTILSGASPDQNFNAIDVVTVSEELPSVGLLRFDVGGLSDTVVVQRAILTLPHAAQADSCGPQCGACAGIARSGLVEIFSGRDDWIASEVTWNSRGMGQPWGVPGAAGPTDRFAQVGSAAYEAEQTTDVELTAAAVSERDDRLTLLVVGGTPTGDPGDATKLVIESRENACSQRGSAALQIELCPP